MANLSTNNNIPGLGTRIALAFKAFFKILSHAPFASQVQGLLTGGTVPTATVTTPAELPAPSAKPAVDPLQLLAILQREGRLVDFLMEDIQGLPDAQIGAAVREVHQKCRKALQDHVSLAAVVETPEEERMTVQAGYDPSAIRVVGNLGTQPPYTGTVRHRGWRASDLKLQPLPSGQDPRIVAPAEIEVN